MERYGTATRERPAENSPADLPETTDRGWIVLRRRLVASALTAVALASVLSFFVKPRPPILDLVSPAQEIPNYEAELPVNRVLADRVVGSFGMAMVLVRNPYTEQNAAALENVRSWAKQRFQDAPDFLHPISVRPRKEPNDTIFGALGYNLFAAAHYALDGQIGSFVSGRIADFHSTDAYKSFQNAYFSLFGKDNESATLLARYQTERARKSIDALAWTVCWATFASSSALATLIAPRKKRFGRLRLSCAAAWLMVGLSNASHAWMSNSIPAMLCSIAAFCTAVFFWRPFLLRTRADASLKVSFYEPGSNWVALGVWVTYSLMAVLILTWIRAGVPDFPDPVTLLLSAFSGNFVQDPEEGKRFIARVVGAVWVAASIWALTQKEGDCRVEDELESLNLQPQKPSRQ